MGWVGQRALLRCDAGGGKSSGKELEERVRTRCVKRLERTTRADRTHNTTKTKRREEGYYIRRGRGLRSVPSDGGGWFDRGDVRISGLFWDTHARRLQAVLLHSATHITPTRLGSGILLLLYYFLLQLRCTDLKGGRSWLAL